MQRYIPILTLLFAATGALTSLLYLLPVPCLLVANFTDSMPRGLYLRRPLSPLRRDSIVLFRLPDAVWADFGPLMRAWGWSPESGPFVKRVGALPGDRVCLSGGNLSVNGISLGRQLHHDTRGNPIPGLDEGCLTVKPGDFLPLSTHSVRSFDGRYYGPVPTAQVEARVVPLWLLSRGEAI
jgi:conjugative transfer signal peptidase TraF